MFDFFKILNLDFRIYLNGQLAQFLFVQNKFYFILFEYVIETLGFDFSKF